MIELAGCVITKENSNKNPEILLIHRNTPELVQWELPGGKVESGESYAQAAHREVFEEIGLTVFGLRQIGDVEFTQSNRKYHYYWLRPSDVSGIPRLKEAMHDDLEHFPVKAIKGPEFSPNSLILARLIMQGNVKL